MLNFIYNPCAGNGKAKKYYDVISEQLKNSDVEHTFFETQGKAHATKIAKELTSGGQQNIIVMGGDGTLHETLNGLHDPANVKLGLIPCGSGNDFAASANIPCTPSEALNIILGGKAKYVDFMECSGIRGINVIGAGIDVDILKRCYSSKFLKGKIKYIISTVISVFNYKCKKTIAKAGLSESEHKCFVLCAGNGKYFGGSIPIAPEATIDDGLLDFVLVNDMPVCKRPRALLKLISGKILEQPYTYSNKVARIQAYFEKPADIEIDGEIYRDLKFDVSVVHNQLQLFC